MKGKNYLKERIVTGLISATLLVQSFSALPVSAETDTAQSFVYDDYEITYDVTNSWGDTEVVSITLFNTGDDTIGVVIS